MVAKSVHPGGAATASTVSTEPAPGAAGGGTAWIDLATSQTHTGYVNHDINLPKNPNHAVEVAHEKINFNRAIPYTASLKNQTNIRQYPLVARYL